MSRDRDIRNDMKARLVATGLFGDDTVLMGQDDVAYPAGMIGANSAKIEAMSDRTFPRWDDGGVLEVEVKVKVILTAQDEDERVRDEAAERLYNAARDALDSVSLAGLTLPFHTGFEQARWLKADRPTRQIEAIFAYRYIQDDGAFDTTE